MELKYLPKACKKLYQEPVNYRIVINSELKFNNSIFTNNAKSQKYDENAESIMHPVVKIIKSLTCLK